MLSENSNYVCLSLGEVDIRSFVGRFVYGLTRYQNGL